MAAVCKAVGFPTVSPAMLTDRRPTGLFATTSLVRAPAPSSAALAGIVVEDAVAER
jgi:hypothetical protein